MASTASLSILCVTGGRPKKFDRRREFLC